jgi:hypothetical protein
MLEQTSSGMVCNLNRIQPLWLGLNQKMAVIRDVIRNYADPFAFLIFGKRFATILVGLRLSLTRNRLVWLLEGRFRTSFSCS